MHHASYQVIEACNETHPFLGDVAMMEQVAKGKLVEAMFVAHADCSGMGKGNVTVVTEPAKDKGVIANKCFKKGECKLVCVTANVTRVQRTEPVGKESIATVTHGNKVFGYQLKAHMVTPSDANQTPACIPFWYVQDTAASRAVTAAYTKFEITLGEFKVCLPQCVNTVPLKKGDTILKAASA